MGYRILAWDRQLVCGGVKPVLERSTLPLTWDSVVTKQQLKKPKGHVEKIIRPIITLSQEFLKRFFIELTDINVEL